MIVLSLVSANQLCRLGLHPTVSVNNVGTATAVCKAALALPPYGKITASSERSTRQTRRTAAGSTSQHVVEGTSRSQDSRRTTASCQADDAYIFTSKAWCSKQDNCN